MRLTNMLIGLFLGAGLFFPVSQKWRNLKDMAIFSFPL